MYIINNNSIYVLSRGPVNRLNTEFDILIHKMRCVDRPSYNAFQNRILGIACILFRL